MYVIYRNALENATEFKGKQLESKLVCAEPNLKHTVWYKDIYLKKNTDTYALNIIH